MVRSMDITGGLRKEGLDLVLTLLERHLTVASVMLQRNSTPDP